MKSLYLGKIGRKNEVYEIHAFTKNNPFREFRTSEISDPGLFQKLLEERYNILDDGRPIFCTAVNPDKESKTESNSHDYREGTVHIAAIDNNGRIVCGLSIAVDTGERDRGDIIGLPLENRWELNGYPMGASLDPFRKKYLKRNLGKDRKVEPWKMAELYRHFIESSNKGNLASRLGVYAGVYHLLVREAKKRGKQPTDIWVFDAIPAYFNLYKWVGTGVLRDLSIEDPPRWISPSKNSLETKDINGSKSLFYKGEKVSRNVKVPFPYKEEGELNFKIDDVPFLDGVIDTCKLEASIRKKPLLFFPVDGEGFSLKDRMKIRATLSTVGRRAFDYQSKYNAVERRSIRDVLSNFGDRLSRKLTGSDIWEFSEIGDLNHAENEIYTHDI